MDLSISIAHFIVSKNYLGFQNMENFLEEKGIITLRQMIEKSSREYMKMDEMGRKRFREIDFIISMIDPENCIRCMSCGCKCRCLCVYCTWSKK